MSWFKPTSVLDRTFEVGIALKGLDGILEVAGGLLLLILKPGAIDAVTRFFTQHELSEDPHDFIATHILQYGQDLAHANKTFAVLFLLTHGLVKIVLVVGLLRNQRWAYPFAFVTLGLFIVYQLYKIALHPTAGMILLTIFDAFIVWLTWREYQKLPPKTQTATPQ